MEKPKHRRKQKDTFQDELSNALQARRAKGLAAGFTSPEEEDEEESDDDYEDDFEDEEVTSARNKTYSYQKTPMKKREWELPSDDDDDDDVLGGGGSMFLKGNTAAQKKSLFDPIGMSKNKEKTQDKSKSIARQSALLHENSSSDEADSFLQLLKGDSKSKYPTPTKRTKAEDKNLLRKSPTSFNKTQRPQSPNRSKSPSQELFQPTPALKKTSRPSTPSKDVSVSFQDTHSPREKFRSPTGRRTPEQRQQVSSPNESRRSLEDKGRPLSPLQRSQERISSPVQRSKSPVGSQQSSALKSILSSMNDQDQSHSAGQNKLKATNTVKSQSFVDFLMDDSPPKPVPRKRGSRSSQDSQSQQDVIRRATSPVPVKTNKTKSPLTEPRRLPSDKLSKEKSRQRSLSDERNHHRSPSDERNRKKSPSYRAASPTTAVQFNTNENTRPLSPLSSLQSDRGLLRGRDNTMKMDQFELNQTQMMQTTSPKHVLNRAESKQAKAEADDMFAIFNHALKSEEPVDIQAQMQKKQGKAKSPVEEVVMKTAEQNRMGVTRQRSSQQLIENVIDNVAEHNEKASLESGEERNKKLTKTTRLKSGKKSYRTPPVNYQGLGSLAGLKDLKKQDTLSPRSEDFQPASSDDIKKAIYMEWLAKREEESKKKNLENARIKKAEKEKQEKERRDKENEAIVTRRAWEETKKEADRQTLRVKKAQERHKRKEEEEKEQQKLKSQKQAERHRQELLDNAKIKHQSEQRKKREEERKLKEKERKNKELNKTAVNIWMNERGDSWIKEQKKKEREKKKKEKEEKYIKETASKDGEEKYKEWRETKDEQLKVTLREKRLKERRLKYGFDDDDDEENLQPPWSPPNKVIPRKR